MKQTFTSAATSVNSRKLPAVYNKAAFLPGMIVIDWGCGKYTDHIREYLEGVEYLPYDPYNQPEEVNKHTLHRLAEISLSKDRKPFIIVCSNVLNVIDDDDTIREMIETFAAFTEGIGVKARALITVYEGDRSGIGKRTGKDSWQRNEKLAAYMRFIPKNAAAKLYDGMIIMGMRY